MPCRFVSCRVFLSFFLRNDGVVATVDVAVVVVVLVGVHYRRYRTLNLSALYVRVVLDGTVVDCCSVLFSTALLYLLLLFSLSTRVFALLVGPARVNVQSTKKTVQSGGGEILID